MAVSLQIKRGDNKPGDNVLKAGELAFDKTNQILYIGRTTGGNIVQAIEIGGKSVQKIATLDTDVAVLKNNVTGLQNGYNDWTVPKINDLYKIVQGYSTVGSIKAAIDANKTNIDDLFFKKNSSWTGLNLMADGYVTSSGTDFYVDFNTPKFIADDVIANIEKDNNIEIAVRQNSNYLFGTGTSPNYRAKISEMENVKSLSFTKLNRSRIRMHIEAQKKEEGKTLNNAPVSYFIYSASDVGLKFK